MDKNPIFDWLLEGDTQAKGMSKNDLHHEIYLSDFRKTAPEDLKTILREPFKLL